MAEDQGYGGSDGDRSVDRFITIASITTLAVVTVLQTLGRRAKRGGKQVSRKASELVDDIPSPGEVVKQAKRSRAKRTRTRRRQQAADKALASVGIKKAQRRQKRRKLTPGRS